MEGLILKRDGSLIETYWKDGAYRTKEISNLSAHHLHELRCSLEDGITLREIFAFLNKDTDFWDIFIGNWCSDFIREGLKEELPGCEDLHFLELYWNFSVEKLDEDSKPDLNFGYRMDFHAVGNESEYGGNSYSVSFIPTNELAKVPVKINTKVNLITVDPSYKTTETHLGEQDPTLFQIIYGIIWELSFSGSPASRDDKKKELMSSYEEALKSCSQKDKEI